MGTADGIIFLSAKSTFGQRSYRIYAASRSATIVQIGFHLLNALLMKIDLRYTSATIDLVFTTSWLQGASYSAGSKVLCSSVAEREILVLKIRARC